MKIDIYQSTKDRTKFLSVPEGTNVSELDLSRAEDVYKEVTPFKKGFDINEEEKHIAMNSEDVIAQINDKGYALHGAAIIGTVG